MKKQLLSPTALLAIAGALASLAWLNVPHQNTAFFEFNEARYQPDYFNVQDESRWIKVTDMGACGNEPVKACRIEVELKYTRGGYLLPTTTLVAQESSPGVAYITGGNVLHIRNKK